MSPEEKSRYHRHVILDGFGEAAQLQLRKSSVLVVGAGGLGVPVLQYLSAAGVGTIGIIDGDIVDESNLQRQVLYDSAHIGKPKAVVAREILRAKNPFIRIEIYSEWLTNNNAIELFENYDLIVDGTDNFQTRYLVNDACDITNTPLVFGSIFKFQGQVSVFHLNNGPAYRCLYPEPPGPGEVPNCSDVGVLGVLPAVIGSVMANEAIKVLTGIGQPLSGRLLLYDALSTQFTELSVERNSEPVTALLTNYDKFCGFEPVQKSISVHELNEWIHSEKKFQLVDVRETGEREVCALDSLHIPLAGLENLYNQIPVDVPVVVYCHHGMRSQMAINYLLEKGFNNLINLEGGIHQWAIQIDQEMATY